MKRIDLVYNSLKDLDKGEGVSTIELSEYLNLERSNVSKDLNNLVKNGMVFKNNSRPVRYFFNNPNTNDLTHKSSLDNLCYLSPSLSDAVKLAKSVIKSSLVKTALFGSDANWGRILCALGYSDVDFDPYKVDVYFTSSSGSIKVCGQGSSIEFDENKAKDILLQDEILIEVNLNIGDIAASAYGCDLTYDYVKINGDYRS